MKRILCSASILLGAMQVASSANEAPEPAFEALKGLQGKWAIESEGRTLPFEMSYEIGSKGSVVSEQFGKELSVFYREGASVMMVHFCNAGNQPRLKMKQNSQAKTLEFEMFEITNLKEPDAAHVQRIVYRIVDERRVDLEIIWHEGKTHSSEKYRLTKG